MMFEVALLFILVLHTFRVHYITNQFLIAFVALNLIIFIYFAIKKSSFNNRFSFGFSQFILFVLIIVSIFGFIAFRNFEERIKIVKVGGELAIHDGLLQTEFASMQLLQGKNPYSITYKEVLKGERYYSNGEHPSLRHYVYSPLMFIVNIPFSIITTRLGTVDLRISLILFFITAGFIGSKIVKEKVLFLTIFYFNPLFVPMLLFGASDIILITFLYLCILFLKNRRLSLATVTLGFATGTKLLILPFLPLYFIYIYFWAGSRGNRKKVIFKQLFIFLLINFLIYIPFAVWNFPDIVDDLLVYPYMVSSGYEISGFIGFPRFLVSLGWASNSLGLLSILTLITFIILSVIILFFSVNVIKKSFNIGTLCFLYSLFFIVILSLSRLFQSNYLSFISQIMLVGSLAETIRRKKLDS